MEKKKKRKKERNKGRKQLKKRNHLNIPFYHADNMLCILGEINRDLL